MIFNKFNDIKYLLSDDILNITRSYEIRENQIKTNAVDSVAICVEKRMKLENYALKVYNKNYYFIT